MLNNCKDCGKLIGNGNEDLCPDCTALRDEEMGVIRDCIRSHNSLTMVELSELTGISTSRIIKFIHEGLILLK